MKPELIIQSAGFDAHALDPIGSLGLEVEDFVTLTRLVKEVAHPGRLELPTLCLEEIVKTVEPSWFFAKIGMTTP